MLKSGGSTHNHKEGSTVRFFKGIFPIRGTAEFLGRFLRGRTIELLEFVVLDLLRWS